MKIIIAKESGEVVEVITDEDIGSDLAKPLARQDLMEQIVRAIKMAREQERAEEFVPPTGQACAYFKAKGGHSLECHNCDFPKRLHKKNIYS